MKMKTYHGTDKTKQRILNAIQELSQIVAATLGPGGRPILLEVENRPPLSTKDGVTVARHYQASGDLEDVVARAAIEICEKTVKDAGDGTTTAIVLGAALVEEGQKFLAQHPSYSPQRLSRELKNIYAARIKPAILRQSVPINHLEMEEAQAAIEHVALISANGDLEIAQAVAKAVKGVGEDGICIAEEGAGAETNVSFDRGFSFNSGLSDLGGSAGPSFVNRNDLGDCMVEGAYVCLYDGEVNDIGTVVPIMQKVSSELDGSGRSIKSPLIVFAHRFSDQVLKMFAQNFRRGTLTVVPVITPRNGQANGRSQFLHDLAAYTGGTVLDSQGLTLTEAQLGALGFCETLKYGRSDGVIIGNPEQENVINRIDNLKKQMEGASEFDQDLIRYRIGRLTGGVATIYAGGKSQLEAKERHARVVDAICAVRSALKDGVVPGGGCTLAAISKDITAGRLLTDFEKAWHKDPRPIEIFTVALRKAFDQILENAGMAQGDIETNFEGIGFDGARFLVCDAARHGLVDWWTGGIMDPTRVTLSALENALSVAQLLMTLGGAIVVQKNEGEEQVKAMQQGLLKAIENETLG